MTDMNPLPVPEEKTIDDDKSIHPVLVIFLLLPLLGIIAALLMIINDMQRQDTTRTADTAPNPSQLISFAAPEFTLNDLNGNPVALSDYRGKILFLNFWQTTCPPCIEEMPDFIAFMEDQPDDVTWLTVNFGENETMVREFFAAYDFIGIPTVLDPNSNVRFEYGVFGAPVTFVINPDGVIQYMNIGQLSYDDMVTLADAVRDGA